MARDKGGSHSPLIYEYLKRYQQDPSSRIFAPLAELYRKAGLVDEALEIAREGLRVHPHFVGGRVALARALFDKKRYEEVIAELLPIIRDVPDNLVAQRMLAESCLILGRVAEALGAYKMLLYYSPADAEVARMVKELEAQAYEKGLLVLRKDPEPAPVFRIASAVGAIEADPGRVKARRNAQIERLQEILQQIERYRHRVRPVL